MIPIHSSFTLKNNFESHSHKNGNLLLDLMTYGSPIYHKYFKIN
jgi:hypothetical protein